MKYERGVRFGLTEAQQSFIYWSMHSFDDMPIDAQHTARDICAEIAGNDADALFICLTTETPLPAVATEHRISAYKLKIYVKKFYETFVSRYV